MNSISIIPAPVAAQISGAGSFFGSCQIASGNFEDMLNAMSGVDSANCEEPAPLTSFFQDFGNSEVLMQLQQILGEDIGVEAFKRVVNLLEKGTLSVQADTVNWDKDTFEKLTVSLLERLDIAIKQMAKTPNNTQGYESEDDSHKEKFLNLVTDLLKTGIITPQEYETALKNPEKSSLTEVLKDIKKETEKLIEKLECVEPEQIAQPKLIKQPELIAQPEQTEKFGQVEHSEQTQQPEQTEQIAQPKQVAQPKQTEMFGQVEHSEQTQQFEQAEQIAQPEQITQPKQTEEFGQIAHSEQTEQPEQAEQTAQPGQITQPKQTEEFGQIAHSEQAQQPKKVEQPKQPKQTKQVEQIRQSEQIEQIDSLAKELQDANFFIQRTFSAMEIGVRQENKDGFYEVVDGLWENGIINEQDLKNAVKIQPVHDENNSSELNPEESKEKKKESVFVKNVLEKFWAGFKSESKVEKENVPSKFNEITEVKSTFDEKTEIKPAIKPVRVEPEIRAVWEGGDLKIETVNPKTGEKLQSIPVANTHKMQERINEFEVVRQVVAQAKFITTPTGEQKLTMQLRPEHLGQMNLRIVLNNGEMQIHARVESTTAQAALESHIGLLREGLEKQGINLDRLEVSVEQKDRQDAFSLAERQEQHERHGSKGRRNRSKEMHLAISVKNDDGSDTGRRLGYNTMEYLA